MNTEDKPAALASAEGLGLLPEYAHAFRPRWPGDEGGFTGAQMRLYALDAVAVERERWRRIAKAAQAVTEGSTESLRDVGDGFSVPSHLMAALALALDEWPNVEVPGLRREDER